MNYRDQDVKVIECAVNLADQGEHVVLVRPDGKPYGSDWRYETRPTAQQLRLFFKSWRDAHLRVVRNGELVDPLAPPAPKPEPVKAQWKPEPVKAEPVAEAFAPEWNPTALPEPEPADTPEPVKDDEPDDLEQEEAASGDAGDSQQAKDAREADPATEGPGKDEEPAANGAEQALRTLSDGEKAELTAWGEKARETAVAGLKTVSKAHERKSLVLAFGKKIGPLVRAGLAAAEEAKSALAEAVSGDWTDALDGAFGEGLNTTATQKHPALRFLKELRAKATGAKAENGDELDPYIDLTDEDAAELRAVIEGKDPKDASARMVNRCNLWQTTGMSGAEIIRRFVRLVVRVEAVDELEYAAIATQLAPVTRVPKADIMRMVKIARREWKTPNSPEAQVGAVRMLSDVLVEDAAQFVDEKFVTENGDPTMYFYGGVAHLYDGRAFMAMAEGALTKQVVDYFGESAITKVYKDGSSQIERYSTSKPTITNLLVNIEAKRFINAKLSPAPFWLPGAPENRTDPHQVIAFKNCLLHWPSGTTAPHSPYYFTLAALPYDYDPTAHCPNFDKFLGEVFATQESRDTLMEFMGLCMTDITWFHIMLWLLGPPGTGKGTILRILKLLVGEGNTYVTSMSQIGGTFGMEGAIGKKLIAMPDVRISHKHSNVAASLEIILTHVGEDMPAIKRKNLKDYEGGCTAKALVLANEIPYLHDSSGALLRRSLVLETQARLGSEGKAADGQNAAPEVDTQLGAKLAAELPGIAVKALAALRRLIKRGHFIQPQEGKAQLKELEHTVDHVAAWMDEECVVGAEESSNRDEELYPSYTSYCHRIGYPKAHEPEKLGRFVAARLRRKGIKPKTEHTWAEGVRAKVISGIRPKNQVERGAYTTAAAMKLAAEAAELRRQAMDKELGAGMAEQAEHQRREGRTASPFGFKPTVVDGDGGQKKTAEPMSFEEWIKTPEAFR
jgi:putative DNA primase/helicase